MNDTHMEQSRDGETGIFSSLLQSTILRLQMALLPENKKMLELTLLK